MREIGFSLPVSLIRQYEEAAERLGLSRSLVMRRAVERGLNGAVMSLQRDLETEASKRWQEPDTLATQLAKEAESRATELVRRLRAEPRKLDDLPMGPAPPASCAEIESFLVLTQSPGSCYQDVLGTRYHFPDIYRSQIDSGDSFVYHMPQGGYIGGGRIGPITPDPDRSDHWYAEIVDYKPFARRVDLKDEQGSYWEIRSDIKEPAFQRAVRRITRETYCRILAAGALELVDERPRMAVGA